MPSGTTHRRGHPLLQPFTAPSSSFYSSSGDSDGQCAPAGERGVATGAPYLSSRSATKLSASYQPSSAGYAAAFEAAFPASAESRLYSLHAAAAHRAGGGGGGAASSPRERADDGAFASSSAAAFTPFLPRRAASPPETCSSAESVFLLHATHNSLNAGASPARRGEAEEEEEDEEAASLHPHSLDVAHLKRVVSRIERDDTVKRQQIREQQTLLQKQENLLLQQERQLVEREEEIQRLSRELAQLKVEASERKTLAEEARAAWVAATRSLQAFKAKVRNGEETHRIVQDVLSDAEKKETLLLEKIAQLEKQCASTRDRAQGTYGDGRPLDARAEERHLASAEAREEASLPAADAQPAPRRETERAQVGRRQESAKRLLALLKEATQRRDARQGDETQRAASPSGAHQQEAVRDLLASDPALADEEEVLDFLFQSLRRETLQVRLYVQQRHALRAAEKGEGAEDAFSDSFFEADPESQVLWTEEAYEKLRSHHVPKDVLFLLLSAARAPTLHRVLHAALEEGNTRWLALLKEAVVAQFLHRRLLSPQELSRGPAGSLSLSPLAAVSAPASSPGVSAGDGLRAEPDAAERRGDTSPGEAEAAYRREGERGRDRRGTAASDPPQQAFPSPVSGPSVAAAYPKHHPLLSLLRSSRGSQASLSWLSQSLLAGGSLLLADAPAASADRRGGDLRAALATGAGSLVDEEGNSALHWACKRNAPEVIARFNLLALPTLSIFAKNANGETPADLVPPLLPAAEEKEKVPGAAIAAAQKLIKLWRPVVFEIANKASASYRNHENEAAYCTYSEAFKLQNLLLQTHRHLERLGRPTLASTVSLARSALRLGMWQEAVQCACDCSALMPSYRGAYDTAAEASELLLDWESAVAAMTQMKQRCSASFTLVDRLRKERLEAQLKASAFQVLGVEKGASAAEINRAFRKWSIRFHPDKSSGLRPDLRVRNENFFKRLNEARLALLDRERCAVHMRLPHQPLYEHPGEIPDVASSKGKTSEAPRREACDASPSKREAASPSAFSRSATFPAASKKPAPASSSSSPSSSSSSSSSSSPSSCVSSGFQSLSLLELERQRSTLVRSLSSLASQRSAVEAELVEEEKRRTGDEAPQTWLASRYHREEEIRKLKNQESVKRERLAAVLREIQNKNGTPPGEETEPAARKHDSPDAGDANAGRAHPPSQRESEKRLFGDEETTPLGAEGEGETPPPSSARNAADELENEAAGRRATHAAAAPRSPSPVSSSFSSAETSFSSFASFSKSAGFRRSAFRVEEDLEEGDSAHKERESEDEEEESEEEEEGEGEGEGEEEEVDFSSESGENDWKALAGEATGGGLDAGGVASERPGSANRPREVPPEEKGAEKERRKREREDDALFGFSPSRGSADRACVRLPLFGDPMPRSSATRDAPEDASTSFVAASSQPSPARAAFARSSSPPASLAAQEKRQPVASPSSSSFSSPGASAPQTPSTSQVDAKGGGPRSPQTARGSEQTLTRESNGGTMSSATEETETRKREKEESAAKKDSKEKERARPDTARRFFAAPEDLLRERRGDGERRKLAPPPPLSQTFIPVLNKSEARDKKSKSTFSALSSASFQTRSASSAASVSSAAAAPTPPEKSQTRNLLSPPSSSSASSSSASSFISSSASVVSPAAAAKADPRAAAPPVFLFRMPTRGGAGVESAACAEPRESEELRKPQMTHAEARRAKEAEAGGPEEAAASRGEAATQGGDHAEDEGAPRLAAHAAFETNEESSLFPASPPADTRQAGSTTTASPPGASRAVATAPSPASLQFPSFSASPAPASSPSPSATGKASARRRRAEAAPGLAASAPALASSRGSRREEDVPECSRLHELLLEQQREEEEEVQEGEEARLGARGADAAFRLLAQEGTEEPEGLSSSFFSPRDPKLTPSPARHSSTRLSLSPAAAHAPGAGQRQEGARGCEERESELPSPLARAAAFIFIPQADHAASAPPRACAATGSPPVLSPCAKKDGEKEEGEWEGGEWGRGACVKKGDLSAAASSPAPRILPAFSDACAAAVASPSHTASGSPPTRSAAAREERLKRPEKRLWMGREGERLPTTSTRQPAGGKGREAVSSAARSSFSAEVAGKGAVPRVSSEFAEDARGGRRAGGAAEREDSHRRRETMQGAADASEDEEFYGQFFSPHQEEIVREFLAEKE
ncbi:DnaJ domain-containing protein [Besnoitia besnoiti]|uniref:DnaJ domain-containing protein n=1 Tax=Besnoitia besnoiti TaxID=94643 RepID=A0A2A9M0P6_BESBE|nr:DnaJ domain-containing protein [Besnoitia besnoiti]PFH31545.1 DnaJ domain-containing protein [Besnoitia besnoiti]